MGLPLRDKVDLDRIERIISTSPDDLAPQLGVVLRRLYERYEDAVNEARSFLDLTVITNSYKEILRELIDALYKHGVFTKFLNLDMGSGKTHLLTLLVYMLYAYEDLREKIGQLLREGGLEEEIKKLEDVTRGVAVLAVDMRTPSDIMSIYLPLFAKSLEQVGEGYAAEYVMKDCVERNRFPEPSELVDRLRKGTRIVIIIDELHNAVLTYSPVEGGVTKDWRYVVDFIKFVLGLMNYLRGRSRGFAVLVASARSDVDRVKMINAHNSSRIAEVKEDINHLLDQLGRIQSISGNVSWLSINDAKEIILRRIGAKGNRIFHELFDEFISRVIKADTDIPQAQHMRSLIKAMAVFTKNAINKGHPVVSPAAFSEAVIDALFPSGYDPTATTYKTNYEQTIKKIEEIAGNNDMIKEVAECAVNAIFTMSISGKPEQIIDMMRTYKSGAQPSSGIPYIPEGKLTELLRELKFDDKVIQKVSLDILSRLKFIHSVKVGGETAYFAIPHPSIVSLFIEMFENKYRNYMSNDIEWGVNKLITWLHDNFGGESEYALVSNLNEMEGSTKGLGSEGIRIIIITDKEVIKGVSGCSNLECIDNTFEKLYKRRLSVWLKEQNKPFQLAVIVPRITNNVIMGLAEYNATLDAINYIVSNYLENKGMGLENDIMYKLRELELEEIHNTMANRTEKALRSAVSALSEAISAVLMYRCRISESNHTDCGVELVSMGESSGGVNSSEIKGIVSSRSYAKVIEQIEELKRRNISTVTKKVRDQIKSQLGFVDDKNLALDIVLGSVVDRLQEMQETESVEIREDQNVWVFGDRMIYVPPKVMRDVIKGLTPERIKSSLRDKAEVEVIHRDNNEVEIKLKRELERPRIEPSSPPSLRPETKDKLEVVVEEMRNLRRGKVIIELKFDDEISKDTLINYLKTYVRGVFKKYLNDIKVEGE